MELCEESDVMNSRRGLSWKERSLERRPLETQLELGFCLKGSRIEIEEGIFQVMRSRRISLTRPLPNVEESSLDKISCPLVLWDNRPKDSKGTFTRIHFCSGNAVNPYKFLKNIF